MNGDKMKKIQLIGLGNNEKRNYFVFRKNKSFLYSLPPFFDSLNIQMPGSLLGFVSELSEKEQDAISENLSEYTDYMEYLEDDDYTIELFYGKEKIFLVINTEPENRERIIEELKKVADFEGF